MGTAWSEVICNYAMPLIDDVRLTDLMAEDQALFLRRLSIYVDLALPMLSRPPELDAFLKHGIAKPAYDDFSWVSTQESTEQETVVDTGLVGYQLFNCSLMSSGDTVTLTPVTDVVYDAEAGTVTFPTQEEAGLEYDMNFYTDGSFGNDLTDAQKRLLGMAIAVVWDEGFSRNWLNIQPKDKDSSFDTVNESNYMREAQSRLSTNWALFNDELRKYEQDLAYAHVVRPRSGLSFI